MAAQRGNKYASKHGVRSFLATGSFPVGASRIAGNVGKLRAELEGAVIARKGVLDTYSAAVIQTAIRHEATAQLLQRWLRLESEKMTVAERVSTAQAIARSSTSRDASLKELGLHIDPKANAIDVLYGNATDTRPEAEQLAGV